jgi:glycerol uptake facilitator-like aquaporin
VERRPNLVRRAAAEGIGVFALVFAGCGAIVAEAQHPAPWARSASRSSSA